MDYVSQDSMRLVAIGLLSIAAVSMGAATIESTVALGTGDTASGDTLIPIQEPGEFNDTDVEGEQNVSMNQGERNSGITVELTRCVEPLAAWWGGLLYWGAFLGVLYAINRRYSMGAALIGGYAMAPIVFSGYFLSTDCTSLAQGTSDDSGVIDALGDAAGQSLVSPEVSPLLVAGVFGVAIVAVAVVLFRASGDQTVTALDEDEEDELDQPDVADLAAAAGRAADRLEEHNVDVDNEVYRAWWEMTSMLNVPKPEAHTPGEFAQAAIEVGLDEGHVTQLTQLFEEVRYGRRDPESREERAVSVFRAIEAEYGDATADDEADASGGTDGR